MENDNMELIRDTFYVGMYETSLALCNDVESFDKLEQEEIIDYKIRNKILLKRLRIHDLVASTPFQRVLKCMSEMKSENLSKALENFEPKSSYAVVMIASYLCPITPLLALQWIQEPSTLDMYAMRIQIYLSIHRIDLANNDLSRMQVLNEEAVLTRLAAASIYIFEGNYLEAFLSYGDIVSLLKSVVRNCQNQSDIIQNALGVCNMCRDLWNEAIDDLSQIISDNSATLKNLLCCYRRVGNKEADIIFQRLSEGYPEDLLVKRCTDELDFAINNFFDEHNIDKRRLACR